jgi:YbbR domain-containing protein
MPSPTPKPSLGRPDLGRALGRPQLRRLVTRNFQLKLLSIFLAVTIWGFIAPQRRGESTEMKFLTPLVLKNIPPKTEITSELVQSVGVLVRVPRALAKSINPNLFQVSIDLRNQLAGSFEYQLTQKNLTYNNEPPPPGLDVLQISPQQFTLTLEELAERTVAISPRLVGEVEKGMMLDSVTVTPAEVVVAGPKSIVDTLESVSTRPLDVEGLNTNVEMLATLEAPAPQVRIVSADGTLYRADIKVTFTPMRVLLREIPVIFENAEYSYRASTQYVNALLEGSPASVANLSNRNVFAVIDLSQYPPGDYRGISPKVVVPGQVKAVEQWPIVDLFVLKRKIAEAERN